MLSSLPFTCDLHYKILIIKIYSGLNFTMVKNSWYGAELYIKGYGDDSIHSHETIACMCQR